MGKNSRGPVGGDLSILPVKGLCLLSCTLRQLEKAGNPVPQQSEVLQSLRRVVSGRLDQQPPAVTVRLTTAGDELVDVAKQEPVLVRNRPGCTFTEKFTKKPSDPPDPYLLCGYRR
jgi:hypothetical protein